jgi:hypothetical protein
VDCERFEEEFQKQKLPFHVWKEDSMFNTFFHILTYPGASELDPILCPSYLYGYNLRDKFWSRWFVDQLEPVIWKENPLDSLVLANHQKRLVQALSSSHKFPKIAKDEASTKGKGLVMLLHGAPGSGKTLTAGKSIICYELMLTMKKWLPNTQESRFSLYRRVSLAPGRDGLHTSCEGSSNMRPPGRPSCLLTKRMSFLNRGRADRLINWNKML